MSAAGSPRLGMEVSSLLVHSPSGIGVFGRSIIASLLELPDPPALHLLFRLSRARRRSLRPSPQLPCSPYLTGFWLHGRFPLIHALDTRLPLAYRGALVATVYDVISALPISRDQDLAPERFRSHKREQYARIARRADHIVTISRETRSRFLEHFEPRARVEVVHPGVDPIFNPGAANAERLARLGLEPERYLLFVGELCARKNLEGVVETFRALRRGGLELDLVLVGRESYGWQSSRARRLIEEDPRGIRRLGFLSEVDLASVYASAAALLYLSHYEGFGLPVLEAMASGTPVIASRRGGIPEAAGEVGRLVEPDDPAGAAEAVAELLADRGARRACQLAGQEWSSRFSWRACAEALLRIYRSFAD